VTGVQTCALPISGKVDIEGQLQATGSQSISITGFEIEGDNSNSGGGFENEILFNIGGGSPASIEMTGYLQGSNDDIRVQAWDYSKAVPAWVTIGTMIGTSSSSDATHAHNLTIGMVGTGADRGKVLIRFYNDNGGTDVALTSANFHIDQMLVAFNQGVEGYQFASIWHDSTGTTNANTVVGIDGTASNPVTTEAATITLLSNTNYNGIVNLPGSTYTAGAANDGLLIKNHGGTIDMNGQSFNDTHIFDGTITGVGTAANEMEFHDCEIGTASVQKAHHYNCTFDGTESLTLAGNYHYINCQSGVAGAGSPVFAFSAVAITAEFRRWSGSITFSGLTSDDTITVGGEMGTIDLGSPASAVAVEIRGSYKSITNVGSASVNVTGAILAADVAAILVDTGTTLPATLSTIAGYIDTEIAAILLDTGTTLDTVVDTIASLLDDARGEPGQGAPPVNPDLATKIDYLYKAWRNKTTQTATLMTIFADDGATADHKSTVSDNGTTATKGEIVTGA